jgi:two-component SAPR family response regulator
MTPAEERRIRGAVEREAEVIVKRMQEIVDGLRELETTYSDRFSEVFEPWTQDDRDYLERLGMPLP